MFSLHSQPCFRFCEICDMDARPKGQTSRVRESLRNDQQIYYLANLYKAAPWYPLGLVDGCRIANMYENTGNNERKIEKILFK